MTELIHLTLEYYTHKHTHTHTHTHLAWSLWRQCRRLTEVFLANHLASTDN